MEYQASDDRLSDLPFCIIHDILERVPIRDAIRTSVLSRQWRYTWTTLPCLLFEPINKEVDDFLEGFEESRVDFVTNVLLHHKGPIRRFEMLYYYFSISNFEELIHCLSRKDVRELIIRINWGDYGANLLKSSIYSCEKLTHLELCSFTIDPPSSTFKGFLFLTSLVLDKVKLFPDGVQTLVGNCPLLESFVFKCCSNSELVICSPNLKDLCIIGDYRKLHLYAPLLATIYVDLMVCQYTQENQSSVCNYTNFLGGLTNLVEIGGGGCFTQYLSIGIESCYTTVMFHHLSFIDIYEVNFRDIAEISVVARLIIGAPNLQKLEIQAMVRAENGAPDLDLSSRDYFGFAPDFKLEKLKVVSLSCVCHYPTGMQLVKFLLESSPMLETMELQLARRSHFENLSAQVLGLQRAYPDVKIILY